MTTLTTELALDLTNMDDLEYFAERKARIRARNIARAKKIQARNQRIKDILQIRDFLSVHVRMQRSLLILRESRHWWLDIL